MLTKLHELGTEKIEKAMSIEKIIKTLRDIKFLAKNKLYDPQLCESILKNKQNVIDLNLSGENRKENNFEPTIDQISEVQILNNKNDEILNNILK